MLGVIPLHTFAEGDASRVLIALVAGEGEVLRCCDIDSCLFASSLLLLSRALSSIPLGSGLADEEYMIWVLGFRYRLPSRRNHFLAPNAQKSKNAHCAAEPV